MSVVGVASRGSCGLPHWLALLAIWLFSNFELAGKLLFGINEPYWLVAGRWEC